jgi:polyisoprenoid-binding protein YceI
MTETSGTWTLDPAASSVTFSAKSMWGLATVKGTFGILSGEGTVAEDGSATGKVAVDAGSVNTRNSARDKHLKSADFLNVEEHPSITVTIASATRDGGTLNCDGLLEAAGHSTAVSFPVTISEAADGSVVLAAQLPVNFRELGMTWNRGGMIGPVAKASVSVTFRRG